VTAILAHCRQANGAQSHRGFDPLQADGTSHVPGRIGWPRHRSVLVFEPQPDEGIDQTLAATEPSPELTLSSVKMKFRCAEAFGVEEPPRAYAWLLLDVGCSRAD
jgi:glucose-6-phosphate 1-dehydrogenase